MDDIDQCKTCMNYLCVAGAVVVVVVVALVAGRGM
jgi:hypothetical protein